MKFSSLFSCLTGRIGAAESFSGAYIDCDFCEPHLSSLNLQLDIFQVLSGAYLRARLAWAPISDNQLTSNLSTAYIHKPTCFTTFFFFEQKHQSGDEVAGHVSPPKIWIQLFHRRRQDCVKNMTRSRCGFDRKRSTCLTRKTLLM